MFTEFDVIVSVIVLISAVASIMRGFVKDFMSFVNWTGATIATLYFFPYAVSVFEQYFRDPFVGNVVSIIVVFVLSAGLITLLTSAMSERSREFRTSATDKFLGGLFGTLKGFIIVSVIHFSIFLVAGEEPDWLKRGSTYGFTKYGADKIHAMAKDTIDEIRREDDQKGTVIEGYDERDYEYRGPDDGTIIYEEPDDASYSTAE